MNLSKCRRKVSYSFQNCLTIISKLSNSIDPKPECCFPQDLSCAHNCAPKSDVALQWDLAQNGAVRITLVSLLCHLLFLRLL